jgi:hypothetical protein
MRRLMIVVAFLLGSGMIAAVIEAGDGFTITSGVINANDHELAEGYFAVGVGREPVQIMVVPNSTPWLVLREHRGKKVILRFEVIP